MFRALEKQYGEVQAEKVQGAIQATRLKAVKLLRSLHDEATMPRRALSVRDREMALRIIRQNSPVGRLISRNTRDLLRRYYKEGRISTPIADRSVDDRFLDMSAEERHIYELVETYIRNTYKQASPEIRTAVGFVMTIYRKRLASSFYALAMTLEKRLAALKQGDGSLLGSTDEDMPDDDLADEQLDADEIAEMEREALNIEERSTIEDLLLRVNGLPPDRQLAAGIEEDIATAGASSFDLDSLVVSELDVDQRPAALYGLGELRDVLANQETFIPDIHLETSNSNEFQYLAPGKEKLRITVSPEYYDTHSGDVELWSPGNPAFPDPREFANRQAVEHISLQDVLLQADHE